MTKKLKIVLAQLNFTVGDFEANMKKHIEAAIKARDELSADLIVFPELSLTAYPPEDLLLRRKFIDESDRALAKLIDSIKGIYCVVGHPLRKNKKLYNGCTIFYDGKIINQYAKQILPNYGVFDEHRYFQPGSETCVATIHDIPIGFIICEDLWVKKPAEVCAKNGARLIIVTNASPFEINKHEVRLNILSKRAKENNLPIVYLNCAGAQDELVFDGGSMVVNQSGQLQNGAGFFNETLFQLDVECDENKICINQNEILVPEMNERIYQALIASLKNYVEKNNFKGVLLGLSGGIDSALVLAVAHDALGKDKVKAFMLPSQFTTDMSIEDAHILANNFQIDLGSISIQDLYQQLLSSLQPILKDKQMGVTEENIQARCRAVLLMAISNKEHLLLLNTGNRSELAVGYCTLYGDMAGGFALLKDVPKTLVYELAAYRNKISPVIPERILKRAPSAELAPDQKDSDTLPPYSILDVILENYLNLNKSVEEIVQQGFDETIVKKVIEWVRRNEYKRKQSPIGPHIEHKSFGKDWRYPITNHFKA